MENLVATDFWDGRRVFLTGHTGFKGSWLALWLQTLRASVFGYALRPPTSPSLFAMTQVERHMTSSNIADVRDYKSLLAALQVARPEVVFHLAAQPLVGEGYRDPLGTFSTNVMGTANLLEAVRHVGTVRAVVVITTDKCYENKEWPWPYRENDAMGGSDPYSSSKACTELVSAAYRNSYLDEAGIRLATARAGNVIGGGDWAPNRLLPDLMAAFIERRRAVLRRPDAVRPWQHVLEPLCGYLLVAQQLLSPNTNANQAWNFGPDPEDCLSTAEITRRVGGLWGEDTQWTIDQADFPHETTALRLDSSKAQQQLGWRPRWRIDRALAETVAWYRAYSEGADMHTVTLEQIAAFSTN